MKPKNKRTAKKNNLSSKSISLINNNFFLLAIGLIIAMLIIYESTQINPINTTPPITEEQKYDLSCEGCNIIFLNVELLRADYVDLINHDKNITPNIDAFFNEGLIFENTRSAAGQTYNSITSTFTSTAPEINEHRYKLPGNWVTSVSIEGKLTVDFVPSIPQILKQNEYSTIALNSGPNAKINLERGFDKYFVHQSADMYKQTTDIISKLELLEKDSNKYFLHNHIDLLHYPYKLPKELVPVMKPSYKVDKNTVIKEYEVPLDSGTKVIGGPFKKTSANNIMYNLRRAGKDINYTFDDYAEILKEYEASVIFVDGELGKIFKILEDKNYLDNTIVVLFANHGEGLFDNQIPVHAVCYESCVHVPLFIRHPKIKENIVVTDQLNLIDLAPTLYDMLNIKIDYNISGKSFYEELSKTGKINREYVYGADSSTCTYIKKDNFKLIIKSGKINELYDLNTDPHETNNLYANNKTIAQKLEAAIDNQKIETLTLLEELKTRFNPLIEK